MKTTTFYKKDGDSSSVRVSIGNSSNQVSITSYIGSSRGGVTFKNKGFSSRMNNKGQSMGSSIKTGSSTFYMDSYGRPSSRLKPF